MPETGERNRLWLALIIGLYGLLGLAMSLQVPLAEAPDELDHFLYLRYLAQEKTFPPLSPVAAENPTMEANQPPLYYALGALATGWADMSTPFEPPQNGCFSFAADDPGRQTFYVHSTAEAWPFTGTILAFHAARLFSVLLGASTVWLTYRLARRVVPAEPRAALLAAALLAFNPQFIFITASVNNDVLAATLGAAIVLAAVACWQEPRSSRFLLLGLLTGLGALTKAGLLALWPVALLAAAAPLLKNLAAPRQASGSWGKALRDSLLPLALVIGLPLLLAGWWYARATLLYGDPLAWRVHLAAKGPFVLREGNLGISDLGHFASLHFRSYWALFGWLNVAAPDWVTGLLLLITGTAAAGLAWGVAACWRGRQKEAGSGACFFDPAALGLTILAVLATYVSLLRYIQTINWSGYQGRLAFAVAGPLAVVLAAGLAYLAQRAARAARGALWLPRLFYWAAPLFLLLLAAVSLVVLLPDAYPRPGIYQPPALSSICARYEDGLLLDGFSASERVSPGANLEVTLAGYGMQAAPGAGAVAVELRGDGGQVWGTASRDVTWAPGETIAAVLSLPVSEAAVPGRATLVAGLRTAAGAWLPAASANGRVLEVPIALQTVKIPQGETAPARPQMSQTADLGGQLRLLGYDLQGSGDTVTVRLYWQALAPMETDLTTFIHLVDAHGRLLAQADGQPQNGRYPTSIWDEGEVVAEVKELTLPQGPVQEPLQLLAGAYRLPGGERLALDDAAGDSIPLASFAALSELGAGGTQP